MSILRRENEKRHLFALFVRTPPGKDGARRRTFEPSRSVGELLVSPKAVAASLKEARGARDLSAALRTAKRLQEYLR
jgi:hypothetical protein